MTANEFRAWLDGFSHAIDGAPTAEQWELVKRRAAEITAELIYVPGIQNWPPPSYPPYPTYPTPSFPFVTTSGGTN